jgi:hypothetical protein
MAEYWRMIDMITIDKTKIDSLIEYIHTLLDFVDVEEEENVNYINNGYNDFVEPIIQILHEQKEERK